MNDQVLQSDRDRLRVRSFEDHDQPVVSDLYVRGLLEGLIAPNDTGADIDNIVDAYFDEDRHHFWVAECDGRVVGMIGVGSDEQHTAEVRRLRVDPAFDCGPIAEALLEAALNHCKENGYLKIRLDTRYEKTTALGHFERLGFQLNRTVAAPGKDVLEFYLDLYRPRESAKEAGGN
jgi:ribosomal protein S18 acetylase RimI-like enzyme